MTGAKLAIVIVNYRTADLTMACVASLAPEGATAGPFEVIVVDGNSGDGSAEKLAAHFGQAPWSDWVSVLPLDFNGGFGWANNQAMLRLLQSPVPPDYIQLLNPDTLVEPGAVRALIDVIEADPGAGAVASQLVEDGVLVGSAFRFPSAGREFLRGIGIDALGPRIGIQPTLVPIDGVSPAEWITGASVMFRSAALRQTGLFDDGFFLYFEEVELMRRMTRAGWTMWSVPASRVVHYGGASTGVESGHGAAKRPQPAYRYNSRRRYFIRTGGFASLVAANLGLVFGRLIGPPLRALTRKGYAPVPYDLRMTLRHCLWPTRADRQPSIPRWDEPPGRPPAWSVR